jgi:hypothetical protein
MNAINRDKTRKIANEIANLQVEGQFDRQVKWQAEALLTALVRKDGVQMPDVEFRVSCLQQIIAEEKVRRAEAAELAAELAALESRKTA